MEDFGATAEFIAQVFTPDAVNIIYGAGNIGVNVVFKYMKIVGVPVSAFAVSIKNGENELEGFPVYCLDDALEHYQHENTNFIIAAQELYRMQMKEELEKRNISSYYEISDVLQLNMIREILKADARNAEYTKEKHISGQTVGYLSTKYFGVPYSQERLIIDKIDEAIYVEMPYEPPEIDCMDTSSDKKIEAYKQMLTACYCPDKYTPEVDLIHTFNMVCDTDKPWYASFETTIPRMTPETESDKEYFLYLVDCMKRSNCRKLYALSENAYKIQNHILMSRIPLADVELLMKKTEVLHSPQNILIEGLEFEKKHNTQKIHFIFVGREFFIKGGREMIQALSKFESKYDFKLTLISSLQPDDRLTNTSCEDAAKWRQIICEKRWIDFYESLPNQDVLEKCKEATVGLLPSYADTYGYSVLEMQASGCPVITTNVRAFPEINNEECGWICCIPVNSLGFCNGESISDLSEILEQELMRYFQSIFDNPEVIQKKGKKALERIQRMHDPDEYQNELRKNLG